MKNKHVSAFRTFIAGKMIFAVAAAMLTVTGLTAVATALAEPVLEIAYDQQVRRLTRAQLLAYSSLDTIDIPADVAYGRAMRYQAIPITALLPRLSQAGTMQFTASDGFVANIPAALLAGGKGNAQAWLAIESSDGVWPPLKVGGASAGPFYLVWLTPGKSGISTEQWPYKIARIADAPPLEIRHPQLIPKAPLPIDSAERRGLQVYMTNCAVCHQINGGGDAQIGPDLNKPFNPTEYFQESFLRRFIREPASVRTWPQRTMPGFSPSIISDDSLNDLLRYLRQMAKERTH